MEQTLKQLSAWQVEQKNGEYSAIWNFGEKKSMKYLYEIIDEVNYELFYYLELKRNCVEWPTVRVAVPSYGR